jgi:membrane protease YdiL (CAAX protease family)
MILERKRLGHYNLSRISIAFFLLLPIILLLFQFASHWPLNQQPINWPIIETAYFVQAVTGVGFLVFFLGNYKEEMLFSVSHDRWKWFAIAGVLGLVYAIAWNLVARWAYQMTGFDFPGQVPFPVVVSMFLFQMTGPAVNEEPMLRGILWGYLRSKGFADKQVWIIQAGIFWLAHISHLGFSVTAFFLVLPGGLIFGWLAMKSRSIAPSMIAHATVNTFLQLAFYFG